MLYGIGAGPNMGPGGIDGGGIKLGGIGVFILGSNGIANGGVGVTAGVVGISPGGYVPMKLGLLLGGTSYNQ